MSPISDVLCLTDRHVYTHNVATSVFFCFISGAPMRALVSLSFLACNIRHVACLSAVSMSQTNTQNKHIQHNKQGASLKQTCSQMIRDDNKPIVCTSVCTCVGAWKASESHVNRISFILCRFCASILCISMKMLKNISIIFFF